MIDTTGTWVDVVFVEDLSEEQDEYDAPGMDDRDALAEYLTQWDYGTETDSAHSGEWQPGSADDVSEHVIGGLTYVLTTNRRLDYASLNRRPL